MVLHERAAILQTHPSLIIIVECDKTLTWKSETTSPAEKDYEDFFYPSRGCGTRDGILKVEIDKRGKKIRKRKLLADVFTLFLSSLSSHISCRGVIVASV